MKTPETDAVWEDVNQNILEHARRLERERDRYQRICGELIAAIRINTMRGTFSSATIEDVDEWLKQWTDKLAPQNPESDEYLNL